MSDNGGVSWVINPEKIPPSSHSAPITSNAPFKSGKGDMKLIFDCNGRV